MLTQGPSVSQGCKQRKQSLKLVNQVVIKLTSVTVTFTQTISVCVTWRCRAAGCKSCGRSSRGVWGSPPSSPWPRSWAEDSSTDAPAWVDVHMTNQEQNSTSISEEWRNHMKFDLLLVLVLHAQSLLDAVPGLEKGFPLCSLRQDAYEQTGQIHAGEEQCVCHQLPTYRPDQSLQDMLTRHKLQYESFKEQLFCFSPSSSLFSV